MSALPGNISRQENTGKIRQTVVGNTERSSECKRGRKKEILRTIVVENFKVIPVEYKVIKEIDEITF